MYPLKGIMYDALEIIQSEKFNVRSSGIKIQGKEKDNLCVKAYELLKKDFKLPPIHIYLHKAIPMGAGLGGGSADGAFMLKLLNEEFNLKLSEKKLMTYAGGLGSDCPFFIRNQPALVAGRGEKVSGLQFPIDGLKNKYIVIVYPNMHVNTAEAYKKIKIKNFRPKDGSLSLKDKIRLPLKKWKHTIANDFEEAIFPGHPELKKLKEKLYALGALYASMSGSGSAVYGIFDKEMKMKNYFARHQSWGGKFI